MKYKNAQVILPDALVKELQSYVQGEYIYVPVEQEQQKRWGEVSGYRKELEQRNQKIKQEYQSGISINCLAEKYCLSLYAVRNMLFGKLYIKSKVRGCRVQPLIFIQIGSVLYRV